jgi:hypothetical protein
MLDILPKPSLIPSANPAIVRMGNELLNDLGFEPGVPLWNVGMIAWLDRGEWSKPAAARTEAKGSSEDIEKRRMSRVQRRNRTLRTILCHPLA